MKNKYTMISAAAALMISTSVPALAVTKDEVIAEMASQGYTYIEVSTTLLGRTKIEAEGPDGEREVVITSDGTVIKDETEEYPRLTEEEKAQLTTRFKELFPDISDEEIAELLEEFEGEDIANLSEEDFEELIEELEEDLEEDDDDDEDDDDEEDYNEQQN